MEKIELIEKKSGKKKLFAPRLAEALVKSGYGTYPTKEAVPERTYKRRDMKAEE